MDRHAGRKSPISGLSGGGGGLHEVCDQRYRTGGLGYRRRDAGAREPPPPFGVRGMRKNVSRGAMNACLTFISDTERREEDPSDRSSTRPIRRSIRNCPHSVSTPGFSPAKSPHSNPSPNPPSRPLSSMSSSSHQRTPPRPKMQQGKPGFNFRGGGGGSIEPPKTGGGGGGLGTGLN